MQTRNDSEFQNLSNHLSNSSQTNWPPGPDLSRFAAELQPELRPVPIGSEAAGDACKDTWTLSDVDEAWHGEVADREPIISTAGLTRGKGMKS